MKAVVCIVVFMLLLCSEPTEMRELSGLINNFLTSFYDSVLSKCARVDLVIYGGFSSITRSEILANCKHLSKMPIIIQNFEFNRSVPLVNTFNRIGCVVFLVYVDDLDTSISSVESFGDYFLSSHYIFTFPSCESTESISTNELEAFSIATSKVAKPVFLVSTMNQLQAFTARGAKEKQLIKIYECEFAPGDSEKTQIVRTTFNGFSNLLTTKVNLQGEVVQSLVCPPCMPKEGSTEHPIPVFNTLFAFMDYINATLEMEPVFADMNDGENFRDGEWNEWVKPLQDGTALTSMPLRLVSGQSHVFYATSAFFFRVTFYTALPKRAGMESLRQLADPFDLSVWILTFLFVPILFLLLDLILYAKRKFDQLDFPSLQKHATIRYRTTNSAYIEFIHLLQCVSLLQPILDQGISTNTISAAMRNVLSQLLVAVWLLISIVLGCGYKTKMLENIVLPLYLAPPRTFYELAESKYKIGSTHYSKIRSALSAMNNSMSKAIQEKVIAEYEFVDADCYQQMFESDFDTACMGLEVAFDYIGVKFMVDVRKRRLSVETRQPIFPQLITVGLSKHYPQLVVPFKFVWSGTDNGGLFLGYWEDRKKEENERKGQEYAQRNFKTKKYYTGDTDGDTSNQQVVALSIELLFRGLLLAGTVFGIELTWFSLQRVRNKFDSSVVLAFRVT